MIGKFMKHDFQLIVAINISCCRLGHKLEFDNSTPVLARDANTKGDDWFEIIDPRNPINQRRREESKKIMKEKATKTKNDL